MSKVELTKKWWVANRPAQVKGPELEKALGAVEQADEDALLKALTELQSAIPKVSKALDKKTQKDLLKDLDTLSTLAEAEAKKAEVAAKGKAAKQAKPQEIPDPDEDEEPPDEKLLDPKYIRSAIRQALKRSLVFGFGLASKPDECALAIAPRGNPRRLGVLVKSSAGVPKACWGRLLADENDPLTLTISLDSPPVVGLAKLLKRFLFGQKITLFRKFRVLVNGEEVEVEGGDDLPAPEALASSSSAPTEPSAAEEPMEVLEDRRREFKKARAAWVAVKNKAEEDLEKVKDGAHMAYLSDPGQFPKIVKGCKEIDTILDNLDDELRDTLDQYSSTSLKNQKKLQELSAKAITILDSYHSFTTNNPLLKAIDQKEFADVSVHAPIVKALADLRKALA